MGGAHYPVAQGDVLQPEGLEERIKELKGHGSLAF